MGHSSYVVSFIKFVEKKEYATDFLDGELFSKPWIYFKGVEDKQRGDKLELAAAKLQTEVYFSRLNRSYRFWLEDGDDCFSPVFCMYHVSSRAPLSSTEIKLSDERLREFGTYGVVVKNVGGFLDRLNRNLPGFSYGLIEYVDFNNLTGENKYALRRPILKKDLRTFEHQREFRIYNTHYAITGDPEFDLPLKEKVPSNAFGGIFYSVGNLSDIAEIYSMDELFAGVNINLNNPINKKYLSRELWWNGQKYQEV